MTRTTGKQLTREQQVAISIFIKQRNNMDHLLRTSKYLGKHHPIPAVNYVTASFHPYQISKLPREQHWCWNQSNAKVTINVDDCTFVTLKKISPRSRNCHQGNVPSYKIWLYQVETTFMPEYHFVWCEKGIEQDIYSPCANNFDCSVSGISNEIGTIFPSLISVESLAFLTPFVSGSVATELGWL